jgi:hypothetical protein
MIFKSIQYSLDEVTLIPAPVSDIKSRQDVNPFYENKKLPIFVAPMTCLLNKNNYEVFKNSKAIPVYPVWRQDSENSKIKVDALDWQACSLDNFRARVQFLKSLSPEERLDPKSRQCICIDVANGAMSELVDLVFIHKILRPQDMLMVGNIANIKSYCAWWEAGVDYVRVGIGGGTGCTTSVQTGMHASLPWLLSLIQETKSQTRILPGKQYSGHQAPLVVADGGVDTIE